MLQAFHKQFFLMNKFRLRLRIYYERKLPGGQTKATALKPHLERCMPWNGVAARISSVRSVPAPVKLAGSC